MTAPAVALKNVRKDFGTFTALRDVSFDIADNEFFTLLGPSGCGKTTLLRMIAGFEETTAGAIFLYGDEIENLPPDKRPVNTVFQNYALFPHMNVADNIGFGLRMLRWSDADIAARVKQMVAMVKLDSFAHRMPSQLSGGQQQRVALARAMAPKPKVLLLDEPLSALDLKLRQEMRAELKELQRDTGITFIFVTHDQEEALSMSDRIAVMSAGEVQQIGTPSEIYEFPANRFVADFIGETNLLAATVQSVDEHRIDCVLAGGETITALANQPAAPGQTGYISIRPEQLTLTGSKPSGDSLPGTLDGAVYLGTDTQYTVTLAGDLRLTVRMQNSQTGAVPLQHGGPVHVSIADHAARFLVD
ncbi:ABC transporter ATP-binding protein [Flavimaricola marinus]|uniref:Spermidine/putrescine import ATP-binding protein PotA n=1 Tax=Flavimaricola marinus TaxID=1819565 RepID=A0A238LD39_9RHOB|nr:ABC transporter ATP-binding protein [Flavimaricola marinus]SMY07531.1 Spermidine/putrescine import ATP-binding protein PotA [Flavimaricola marinus]